VCNLESDSKVNDEIEEHPEKLPQPRISIAADNVTYSDVPKYRITEVL
jgi:hypothetical protein